MEPFCGSVHRIISAAALACVVGAPAFAVDGVLEINAACAFSAASAGCFSGDAPGPPVTIAHAGSYVLTSNLVVADQDLNAIEILVNDVTLDLNGHSIQGPNTGTGLGIGVYALNRYNITVRNGRIWGFGSFGLLFETTAGDPSTKRAGHHIEAMHVANNQAGVFLSGGLVVDTTVDANRGFGIAAEATSVSNSTANKNGIDGFTLSGSSATNCVAVGNGQNGFRLYQSSLSGCLAAENGVYGVYVQHSSVTGCRADDNSNSGISMGLGPTDSFNHVYRNSASGNTAPDQIFCPNNGTDNICTDNASF